MSCRYNVYIKDTIIAHPRLFKAYRWRWLARLKAWMLRLLGYHTKIERVTFMEMV